MTGRKASMARTPNPPRGAGANPNQPVPPRDPSQASRNPARPSQANPIHQRNSVTPARAALAAFPAGHNRRRRATMSGMDRDASFADDEQLVLRLHPHWKVLVRPVLLAVIVGGAAL